MLAELRERVVDRALRMPVRAGRARGPRRPARRAWATTSRSVSEAVVEALPGLAGAALSIALTFVGLAAIDVRLALAGALLGAGAGRSRCAGTCARARPAYADERVAGGERAQALLDAVGGARTIRALGLAGVELPRVAARSTAERRGRGADDPHRDRVLLAAERRRARRHRGGARRRLPARARRRADDRRRDRRRAAVRAAVRPVQHRARHGRRRPARARGARAAGRGATIEPPADPARRRRPRRGPPRRSSRAGSATPTTAAPRPARRRPRARAGRARRARRRVGRRARRRSPRSGGLPRADGRRRSRSAACRSAARDPRRRAAPSRW